MEKKVQFALGRYFSLTYPAHQRVIQFTLLAGAFGFVWQMVSGASLLSALLAAVNSGGAAFLAWGLAREFDPDREWTGLLAAALSGLSAAIWGPVGLLGPALFFGLARLVSGIVGLPVTLPEMVVLWLGGFFVMVLENSLAVGIALSLSFAGYAIFNDKQQKRLAGTAFALVAALALGLYLGLNNTAPITPSDIELGVAALISLLVLVRILRLRNIKSKTDQNDLAIDVRRLRAAILIALLAALLSLLLPHSGLSGMAPLWIGLLTASI